MINPQPKKGKKPKKKYKAIPLDIVKAVFRRDNFQCCYCGKYQPEDNNNFHPHHIIHKSQGGKNIESNLNSCCAFCHFEHGRISSIDKKWLKGEDVYKSGRMYEKITQQK